MRIVSDNPKPQMVRPYCQKCGWRKGGPDSWNGGACKCGHREGPIKFVDPKVCPHCEYDRRFPGFEAGGWLQQDNNGPIVSCPVCNNDGKHPRK